MRSEPRRDRSGVRPLPGRGLKGGTTGDWDDWADCFTEDCTYKEHLYGEMGGREAHPQAGSTR